MNKYLLFILISLSILSCSNNDKDNLPNIVFILADDLGYGEIGILGQKKIETPNIDKLAKSGMNGKKEVMFGALKLCLIIQN